MLCNDIFSSGTQSVRVFATVTLLVVFVADLKDVWTTAKKPYNQELVIATYKRLIHSMPHANQYLLLYVLDLLSVFARKSDKNLMTAQSKSPFLTLQSFFPMVIFTRVLPRFFLQISR